MHSIAFVFLHRGPIVLSIYSQVEVSKKHIHKLRIQACFVFQHALVELSTPANDGTFPGYSDSWAEMFVRAWKGGFLVETF